MHKRILKAFVIALASLLVFISLTPMLISATRVNQFLVSCINNRIAGSLHVQELKAGWTDGIFIKGLQIIDPQGREVAAFKKISCDVALLSLIHAPAIEGKIEVDSPKIRLIDDANNGHFSIEEVFTQEKASEATSSASELLLSDFHLSLDIQPQGEAKVSLICQIENTDNGTKEQGSLNIAATAKNFQDLERAYKNALGFEKHALASAVELDCHIDQLPLKALLPFVRAKDPKLAELILPALGPVLNAKISHTLKADDLGLQIAVQSQNVSAKAKASIKGNLLTIHEDAGLQWTIDPLFTKTLLTDIEQQNPTQLVVAINPTSGTIGSSGKMPIDLTWDLASPLVLTSSKWEAPKTCTGGGKLFSIAIQDKVDALANLQADDKKVEATLTVQNPFGEPELFSKITMDGKEPLDLNAAYVNQAAEVVGSFGPLAFTAKTNLKEMPLTVDASFTYDDYTINTPCRINLETKEIQAKVIGDGLDCKFDMQLLDEVLLSKELICRATVTPDRFKAIQKRLNLGQSEKQKEISLAKDTTLEFSAREFRLPLKPFPKLLDSLALEVKGSLDAVTLTEKEGKSLELPKLSLAAEVRGKDRVISFNLASDKSTKATIVVKGSAHNLWNEESLQIDKARILLDTKIQNLPLDIFYSITSKEESADRLVALFGNDVNLDLEGEIQELEHGSFKGLISSPKLKAELFCKLADGALTLTKPITAEYTLTPEAGEVLLKDVNPLLVTAASTEKPIKLTIDSDGFYIPIKHFAKDTINIKNIKLEPGVLTCKNGGMLSLLVSLLKVDLSSSDQVTLWFTPLYVQVKNGIVDCKRTDALLASAFPIATWGKIDLVNDKLDMTLGLSGKAISRGFGIASLDPNYMVQIPIRGSTQSPKIDSGLATTKITALKLQQTKSKSTSLIGGLLEVATTIVEKDAPVPSPTTIPFPWSK